MVTGFTQVQYSYDNVTFQNATNTNANYTILEELDDGINESTTYYFRVRHIYDNGTSNWTYMSTDTNTSGEVSMSSIAVVGFITLLTMLVFFLPRLVGQFSRDILLDTSLRGVCIIGGLLLLSLDVTVVVSIADKFNLGVNSILFRYLWLVNWTCYLSMVIVVLNYAHKGMTLWQEKKQNQRYGIEEQI